jgi:cytochrome c553
MAPRSLRVEQDQAEGGLPISNLLPLGRLWPRALRRSTAAALVLVSALPASAATLEERLAACLACHGAKGQSEIPAVPSLGAQPAFYLTIQLLMFREKMRLVESMNQMMQGLKDDELRSIADHLAKLPPPEPAGGLTDPARMERARAVIEQHRCNFCHKRDFSGEQNVPRLAGQREDYLVKALREYKDNTRRGYDASMADVLYLISDEQIADLAYFLARLR